ncbi:hypothetical protein YWIDRAFT_07136 [Streptomyces sp. SceaMP-e96]|uniref:hypothetical protein n=1 Tax=unclassified Streptomyces TaxID=2593676 RepID=UPI000823EC2B|nr:MULTISPECIES: hypothetical protein [unclassified Streptomyces]MYT17515.1 hypothetical protein [Streptomyces sp. SID4951]SCK42713.1 hypothetical protein YWIDRAFT_07136 [Streptomyces sp. SceaMP-e96]
MGSYADSKYAPKDQCYAIENTTKFHKIDFTTLKAMVADAKPETVAGVSHAWKQVHDAMVADNGGGIRAYFDKAIDEVLEHWEGDAAKAFRERAKKISENIGNGAQYAKKVSEGMGLAHEALSEYKKHLDGMEMPDVGDRAWDWATDNIDRQDEKADSQLASGKSATQVVEDNEDDLSAQKETQLKAAATMEYLGAAYRTNAAAIGNPKSRIIDDPTEIPPPDNSGIPPVHYPLPGSVTRPKGMPKGSMKPLGKGPGSSSDGLKTPGINGGIGNTMPGKGSFTPPSVGTGLDSFTPPQAPTGPSGGVGVPGGGPGTGGLSGGGGPGGIGGGPGGVPGMPGGMAGRGTPGGRTGGTVGGRTGGTSAGAGAAGRGAGRPGMPGMAGAGAAGAKGGSTGAGAAGRGGGLARQKGGLVGGGTGGKGAGGTQGGSGLHRSRGGAQSGEGASGSRRPAGMPGAHGMHGAKAKDDKGQNGERPDYLVEDEETWTPERNVAPKVIE